MPKRIPIARFGGMTERERMRQANKRRKQTTCEAGYGRLWQRIRKAQLTMHPQCEFCLEHGKHTPANEVDHRNGNSHDNSNSNLRSACKPCHSARTAREQSFGRSIKK